MRVLLLGLMGSGKSTVGRLLAVRLGVPYVDNDDEVARAEGRSVVELAALGGEVLHDAEERFVRRLLGSDEGSVAGVPGSAADRPDVVALLAGAPLTAYLHVPPDVLVARVLAGPPRPWIGGDPAEVVRSAYDRRDPVLRASARLTVDGTRPPEQVVDEVVGGLGLAHV